MKAERYNRAERQKRYLEDQIIRNIDRGPFGDENFEGEVHSLRASMEELLASQNPYHWETGEEGFEEDIDAAIDAMMLPTEQYEEVAEVYSFPAPEQDHSAKKRKQPAGERQPHSKRRTKARKQERSRKYKRAA